MPVFTYQAMDRQGREIKDEIEAVSHEEAVSLIRKKGFYPTNVKQKSERAGKRSATTAVVKQKGKSKTLGGGVNAKQLCQFTRQLSTLTDAGLPLVRSLQILEGQLKPGSLKNALIDVTDDVQGGTSFSEALSKHPKIFDKLYVNLVRAGEAGGVLDVILQRLADFQEKTEKLKREVKGALIYPSAVMFIAGCILLFIMYFIIPKFVEMFKDFGFTEGLPLPTVMLQETSNFIVGGGWFLILSAPAAAWFVIRMMSRSENGRLMIDRLKIRAPLFGNIIRKSVISRFCRTLGILISSGVPILEALSIVKEATGNAVIGHAVSDVHDSIREGETIAEPLRQSKVFDEIVIHMIEVGEETGDMDKMLAKVADNYDQEVDAAVSGLMAVFEPVLIIFLGLTVGFIVVALFLPLIEMMNKMGGEGAS